MPLSARISVVIPAYNARDTVRQAVESVLEQSLPPYEVIVVDDGSTDGTGDVVASAFGQRVRVIRQPNRGLAAARTAGHEAAGGELVAWLDADDVSLRERFEVQAAVMEAEPSVIVVATDFNVIGPSAEDHGPDATRIARRYYGVLAAPASLERIFGSSKSAAAAGGVWPYFAGDVRGALLFGNFLHPPTVMVRRSGVARAGPLNGAYPTSEDWLYFVELSRYGSVAFVDEALVSYRASPQQMSKSGPIVAINNLRSFEYVLARETGLAEAHRGRVRRALSGRHTSVSAALAETARVTALRHLLAAVRYGGPTRQHLRVLVKIALPGAALRRIRRIRGTLPSP